MDDRKRYPAASIPPRAQPPGRTESSPDWTCNADAGLFSDTRFAEIEYEVGPASPSPSSMPAPQPIVQRAEDPVRQVFYEMRRLAPRNPMGDDEAKLFDRQARFMEDFVDDYDAKAPFSMYYPSYHRMGYEQLRTYFTWRQQVRGGAFSPISLSYIFVYIYELLGNIGVRDPQDGLERLMKLWAAYREGEPALDKYLPQWLKDYHIYYELPHSFVAFVDAHDLRNLYPELFLLDSDAEHSLMLWNRLSNYDVVKSKFYQSGRESLMQDGFQAVLGGIGRYCAQRNIRFDRLFLYEVEKGLRWRPFPSALFYDARRQPDRRVEMPGGSVYICKGGVWTHNTSIQATGGKELAGYLIRKTEACLRQAVNYKFRITADRDDASFPALTALGLSIAVLDRIIEKSVAEYYADLTRTVVEVDRDNLMRIRMEALGTQERLSVETDAAQPIHAEGPAAPPALQVPPPPIPATAPAEVFAKPMTITRVPAQAPASSRAPQARMDASDAAAPQTPAPLVHMDASDATAPQNPPEWPSAPPTPPTPAAAPTAVPDTPSDGWTTLKGLLSDMEREALSLLARGDGDMKRFADANGVMLEVLADSINEKAADAIGDSLLELADDMVIYAEYRVNVAEMVG